MASDKLICAPYYMDTEPLISFVCILAFQDVPGEYQIHTHLQRFVRRRSDEWRIQVMFGVRCSY
eukprot:scaffold26037_cov36-Prasinocladus_malaysianus.AAC.1